jgi:tRNA A37 threonylcarbamoyltransferase TsaD
VPPVQLCTDNGAMIAMSGLVRLEEGRLSGWDLDVLPALRIGA